jgi:hypothetical protein
VIGVIKVSLKLFFQKTCHFSFSRSCRFESLYLEAHNPSRLSNSRYWCPINRKWAGIIDTMIFYSNRRPCGHFHLANQFILWENYRSLGASHYLTIVFLIQSQHRYFLMFFSLNWFCWLFSIYGMYLLISFLRGAFIELVHRSKHTNTITLLRQLLSWISWSGQS